MNTLYINIATPLIGIFAQGSHILLFLKRLQKDQ